MAIADASDTLEPIPQEQVPPGPYTMDSDTEGRLNTDQLAVNMVVLMGTQERRAQNDLYRQWGRVTEVRKGRFYGQLIVQIELAGGQVLPLPCNKGWIWYVKLASIPADRTNLQEAATAPRA